MKARDVFKLVGAAALVAMAILALPAAASAEPPALTIDPVGSSSLVTAEVSGEVDANEIFTEWFFEVAAEENGGWGEWSRTNLAGYSEAADPEAVGGTIEGLKAGTKYQVRLGAYNFEEFVAYYSAEPNPEFSTEPAVPPSLTLGPAENVESHSAHLSGTIDPEGGNEDAHAGVLPIAWELQTNREGAGWSTAASGELTGSEAQATTPIPVEADLTGLTANAEYKFRLLARYAGREAETGEGSFTTGALAPTITESTLWEPKQTSIQLNAFVNAHHDVITDCHFEYGSGGSLDRTAPCEAPTLDGAYSPPSREGDDLVSARISGLAPGTEYSFRLVAGNGAGSAEEDVHSFETPAPSPPRQACPNEAVRIQQHATALPECRAYEQVSPQEKNGGDVVGDGETNEAAVDGNAVTFNSRTSFGDTVGSGGAGQTQYLARRGAAGWSSHGIDPTPNPKAVQTFWGSTQIPLFSEDLRRAFVWAYDLPVAGDTPLRRNIYSENTEDRAVTPVTVSQTGESYPWPYHFFEPYESFSGLSGDGRHLLFTTDAHLLPEAEAGVPNVYEWNDGELRLVDVLPDGSVPSGGGQAAAGGTMYRRGISRDGSRALFLSGSQLYTRIDGNRTIWISEPEGANVPSEPEGIVFQGATPDGKNIFFSSESPLLDEDTTPGPDLYRWTESPDPENESDNLTLISHGGRMEGAGGPDERGFIGASDNGAIVYYREASDNLFVWSRGESRVVTNARSPGGLGTGGSLNLGETVTSPGSTRVSPNGRWLALFNNDHSLTGESAPSGESQMYIYDSVNNSLSCASCLSVTHNGAEVEPKVTWTYGSIINYHDGAIRPRFLSDKGTVFFSTAEALVPEDVNGVSDTYAYDATLGKPQLISTGAGGSAAMFTEANPSGSDVFIVTPQQLSGSDNDDLVDLYDVRVDGGFLQAPPAAAGCSGEGCKGGSSATPAPPAISSGGVARGNGKRSHRRHHRCRKHKGRRCHHRRPHHHPAENGRPAKTAGRAGK